MLLQGRNTAKYFDEDFKLHDRNRQNQVVPVEIVPTTLEQRIGCEDTGFIAFLKGLLTIDPSERLTAREALAHPWLQDEFDEGDEAATVRSFYTM